MYFLPRTNAFYSRIVYIKPMRRYALTGIAVALFVTIWFFTAHSFLESSIKQAQAEVKQLRQKETLIHQSMSDIAQLKTSIKDMQEQLSLLNQKQTDLQSVMMNIVNQAGMCGLAMQSCILSEPQDEQWYVRNNVNVDVSGSYDQLLKFVQSLSASHSLLAMHHSSLTRSAATNKYNLRCGVDVLIIK